MAIGLAKKVWKEIHKQIKKYNPSKYHAHFFYQDVTELIDTIVEVKWVPDLIIFQYVFSDMEKHCESEKLRSFISKIAQFINVDMSENTYIILNDINLTTALGGGREHFDELLAQIPQIEFRRYHFNNSKDCGNIIHGVGSVARQLLFLRCTHNFASHFP